MKNVDIQEHSCNICVVGGGLAGCMAAIRAAQLNDDVILADKSNQLPHIPTRIAALRSPGHDDPTLLRPEHTQEQAKQGRLSRAVRPQDGGDGAFRNL